MNQALTTRVDANVVHSGFGFIIIAVLLLSLSLFVAAKINCHKAKTLV